MSEPIIVATPFSDLGELAEHFAQRVDGGRLMLPYPQPVDEGAWAQFQVLYADGSVALEGTGKVSGAYDNGEEHPAEYRFDVVLEELTLDGTSEVVFERIVVARDSMMAAEPHTGEVALPESAPPPAEAPAAEEAIEAAAEDHVPEAITGLDALEEPAEDMPADEMPVEDMDAEAFVDAATSVGAISEPPPRRAAPATPASPAAPPAAPRANPRGAQPAPGALPSPHSFASGTLVRPVLPPIWEPAPDVRPDPAPSSGLFDYGSGAGGKSVLPRPAQPPRPELPEEARVGHAPAPEAAA